jgi:2-polyprenyl-3-methyl-5-hydroxy-6-metoxy-1,4-benzoquinol methylase
MRRREFLKYQKKIVKQFESILANTQKGEYDEQAVPAYTNPNPLMRWLFWQRIWNVIRMLEKRAALGNVLDFGSGLGVMLPYLTRNAQNVAALDLDTHMLEGIAKREEWQRITFYNDLDQIGTGALKFDVILALDVLEHVEDLEGVLGKFENLLKPEGILIVSGPTENRWYKIGRKLAGYSGEYHQRNISHILSTIEEYYKITKRNLLYPLFNFFIIATAIHHKDKI